MKTLNISLFLFVMVLMVSCCVTQKTQQETEWDYNINTDFAGLKTYAWQPVPGTLKIDNLMLVRIKDAVNAELKNKGLELVSETPDFFVILQGDRLVKFDTRWRGYDSELYYEQGRLKLAFLDSRSDELIWWGESRADLFIEMTPDDKDKIVAEVVENILRHFPPSEPN